MEKTMKPNRLFSTIRWMLLMLTAATTAFLFCSFAQSQVAPQIFMPVPQISTPSLGGNSSRHSSWASGISSGHIREGRHGSRTQVLRYNAQHQLIAVLEADPNGEPKIETDYVWSNTGKLTQMIQHGLDGDTPRLREFMYDPQNRLLSASHPETGTIAYTYNNALVASRTDARGITTAYTWDDSGRLIGEQYSNGDPSAVYVYDSTSGNLISSYLQTATGHVGERTYQYNGKQLVRVTQNITAEHVLSFDYDASGHLTAITYPDGRVVRQTSDSGGHISSINDQDGAVYLSGLQYDAAGTLSNGYFGNNLTGTFTYNSGELELLRIEGSSKTILSKQYVYTSDGSISSISDTLAPQNGFSYSFDGLQRVAGYSRIDGTEEHSYSYDAFGNLSIDTASPCTFNAANCITGDAAITYDASGDMTSDGRHTYRYDAEGRITQVDDGSVTYLYSAEGDRIQKQVGNNTTETIWVGNQLLAELRPDGNWIDYLYVNGKRMAAIGASGVTYYVSDPLGITRMALSSSGEILAQSEMTPFGQMINRHSDTDEVPFTGGEQYDTETGLYSYKYRYYSPLLGRWMSPDPSGEEYASLTNPQSLNLYSYVINDPLKYVDQSGLCGSGNSIQTCTIGLPGLIFTQQIKVPCSGNQKCAVGNCTEVIYYGQGAANLFGNVCGGFGSNTIYSLLTCAGPDCGNSANTLPFSDACWGQKQLPLNCFVGGSLTTGYYEYCPCCNP
jgi:RHS repeat-associated protein